MSFIRLKPAGVNRRQVRLLYRGAEPIKGFAVYAAPYNIFTTRNKATLIQVLVADKTLDITLSDFPAKANDKIFISAVDRNNNVSDWVQVR